MPSTCCVTNCNSRSYDRWGVKSGLSFYRFPAWRTNSTSHVSEVTKRRRMAWIAAVRRPKLTFDNTPPHMRLCSKHFHKGKPAYEMMECEPDWAPSLNLGHNEVKAKTARRKRIGGKATRTQKQPICSTGDLLMGALDTSEAMQDNIIEVTVGETGAVVDPTNVTRDESPSTMHSSEEHHPVGSWEQATVEAITDMGSLNTTDTGTQIAQATIADLKDENDCLRVQNVNLRSELRLMQWEREQQLRDLQERLEALRQRCSCGAMSDSAKSEVASVATDGDGC
ncbi:uncharacterized protein LOC134069258 isoform X3 [Sardina pilchardus]|uniref:uncharacterized protein LOC134069258 isoform X3 n=1 Tax=Sardina pilchardus TaxID=27697 RepID=UPI002E103A5D